jgi:hypothetical protein
VSIISGQSGLLKRLVVRQGRHVIMSDGTHFITIPRHNPVNALTMGGVVKDAGLTIEQFKELL